MPGFDPIGSTPVASIASAGPGTIEISEQSAAIAFVHIPGVVISEQSVAIAILIPTAPRRRSGMLIG